MIKGLAITPPILGRISIGKVVEKNGKRLPEKDDQFTITSQIQNKDGWIKHPLDEQLRAKAANQKLRTIPVRMIFNDPELNLRAEYSLFDRQTGRPVCVGNGETCQRLTTQGVEQHPCPSPDLCPMAQGGLCKPYGRLHVNLDESDELGTFILEPQVLTVFEPWLLACLITMLLRMACCHVCRCNCLFEASPPHKAIERLCITWISLYEKVSV